jgi:hypothetical protein
MATTSVKTWWEVRDNKGVIHWTKLTRQEAIDKLTIYQQLENGLEIHEVIARKNTWTAIPCHLNAKSGGIDRQHRGILP